MALNGQLIMDCEYVLGQINELQELLSFTDNQNYKIELEGLRQRVQTVLGRVEELNDYINLVHSY